MNFNVTLSNVSNGTQGIYTTGVSTQEGWALARIWITVIIASFILLLNGCVICVYFKMKRNQFGRVSNYALCHQALVDTCVGFVFLIHETSIWTINETLIRHVPPSEPIWLTYVMTRYYGKTFTVLLCVLTLLMNTSDRFFAIYNPLKHRKFSSLRRMVLCTIFVWLSALILPFTYIFVYGSCLFKHPAKPEDCYNIYDFKIIENVLALLGILVVQIFLYKTYKTIQMSLTRITEFDMINVTENNGTNNNNQNNIIGAQTAAHNNDQQLQTLSLQSERRSFRILLRMSLTYIITFIPMSIIGVIHSSGDDDMVDGSFKIVHDCSQLVYISSAIINPLLTLTMRHSFKELFVKGAKRVRSTLSRTHRSTLMSNYN